MSKDETLTMYILDGHYSTLNRRVESMIILRRQSRDSNGAFRVIHNTLKHLAVRLCLPSSCSLRLLIV